MKACVPLQVEFEAHILCVSRTHEYYKMIDYELETPTTSIRNP